MLIILRMTSIQSAYNEIFQVMRFTVTTAHLSAEVRDSGYLLPFPHTPSAWIQFTGRSSFIEKLIVAELLNKLRLFCASERSYRFHKSAPLFPILSQIIPLKFTPFHPDICARLGYYAAWNGRFLPTFRDNLSPLSSRVMQFILLSKILLISSHLSFGLPNDLIPSSFSTKLLC